jgi:hypothetical protein
MVWHLSAHRQEGRTYRKERKKGARVKTTPPRILSTLAQKVTARTITALIRCHSWIPAERPSRCPHACQGVKRLLGAPESLSAPISAANESPRYKELERPESIANNGTPKVKELRTPKVKELRTPKVKELRTPKVKELRTPKVKELRTPKVKESPHTVRVKNHPIQ